MLTAGCGSSSISGGAGVVGADGRIGALRVGASDSAAVVAFAGKPDVDERGHEPYGRTCRAFGYQCRRPSSWRTCTTVFFVEARSDRLESFLTTSVRYRARPGIPIGMPTAAAEQLLHMTGIVGCAANLRLYSGAASMTIEFAGGGVGGPRSELVGGRVWGFVVHWTRESSGIWDCA